MAAPLRIATRESRLALWQAEHVAARLRAAHPGREVVLVPMTTRGDQLLDASLADIGGKGLFLKELEVAMEEQRADLAVHSMKDVPVELPPGFVIAAVLDRADPHDALVSNKYVAVADLPPGAVVGTSSLRRRCQLANRRPDIAIEALRGNVDTRLRKLDEGGYDAIILAAAGLRRLDLEERISALLSPEESLPAIGQGIVGIECRADAAEVLAAVAVLKDDDSADCMAAERALNERLGGSCHSPVAGFAVVEGERLYLRGLVGDPAGRRLLRGEVHGARADAVQLGQDLAQDLLARGAAALLHEDA